VPPAEALKASLANLTTTSQQAAAASSGSLRKQRDTTAALNARMTDAGAALMRLKEELKAKRDEIVASVLDGGEIDSFQARASSKQTLRSGANKPFCADAAGRKSEGCAGQDRQGGKLDRVLQRS
jgi:hypothetical protein